MASCPFFGQLFPDSRTAVTSSVGGTRRVFLLRQMDLERNRALDAIAVIRAAVQDRRYLGRETLITLFGDLSKCLQLNPFTCLPAELIACIIMNLRTGRHNRFVVSMICTPSSERTHVLRSLGISAPGLCRERELLIRIHAWIKSCVETCDSAAGDNRFSTGIAFFLTVPHITTYPNQTLHGKLGWFVCFHVHGEKVAAVQRLQCAPMMHMCTPACTVSAHDAARPRTHNRTRISPFDHMSSHSVAGAGGSSDDGFHIDGKIITYFNSVPVMSRQFY